MATQWTLDRMREDYDWWCAMATAFGRDHDWRNVVPPEFDDVAHVIAASDGVGDGESWIAVFRMRDGRFMFASAWCDYTGWHCRVGGDHAYAATLLDLARAYIGDEERERLGIDLAALEAAT